MESQLLPFELPNATADPHVQVPLRSVALCVKTGKQRFDASGFSPEDTSHSSCNSTSATRGRGSTKETAVSPYRSNEGTKETNGQDEAEEKKDATKESSQQMGASPRYASEAESEPVSPTLSVGRRRSGSVLSLNSVVISRMTGRSKFIDEVWMFLEEPESSWAAMLYSHGMLLFIILTVLMPLMQTLEQQLLDDTTALRMETCFDIVFLAEVLVRWFCCPSHWGFIRNPHNILALAILGPLVLRACVVMMTERASDIALDTLLCVVPLLRLLKALRAFPNLVLVGHAISRAWEALTVPLFLFSVLTLIFSTAIYMMEPRENITSMPYSMYFVIVTVTTVGYGDVTPSSFAGRCLASMLSVVGVLYMAMPLTIVGQAFNDTWRSRHRIILVERLRQRIRQWGYIESDLYSMFKRYDKDGSEDLNEEEFGNMVRDMRLGLCDGAVGKLFNIFDEDKGGTVDFQELLDGIFRRVSSNEDHFARQLS
jgi:hypothetical protein